MKKMTVNNNNNHHTPRDVIFEIEKVLQNSLYSFHFIPLFFLKSELNTEWYSNLSDSNI